jgi:hypothetical protein
MKWTGHVAFMREKSNAYRILLRNTEGKRPLGRIRRRWENNNKMDLRKIGESGTDWADLHQNRDQWRALPSDSIHFWKFLCG